MIAKPDYTIMNGLAHVVLPVANWVGDVITWPIRFVGSTIENVRELSNLRTENEELRVRLDDALRNKNLCEVAIAENQKVSKIKFRKLTEQYKEGLIYIAEETTGQDEYAKLKQVFKQLERNV